MIRIRTPQEPLGAHAGSYISLRVVGKSPAATTIASTTDAWTIQRFWAVNSSSTNEIPMAAASRAAVANCTLPMSMPGDLSHNHDPTTLVPMSALDRPQPCRVDRFRPQQVAKHIGHEQEHQPVAEGGHRFTCMARVPMRAWSMNAGCSSWVKGFTGEFASFDGNAGPLQVHQNSR